jgi:hypothetical protein
MIVIVLDNVESVTESLEMIKTLDEDIKSEIPTFQDIIENYRKIKSMNKEFTKCEQCSGTGKVLTKGMYDSWVCKKCNGTGKTISSIECDSSCICPDCMSKNQVVESWNPINTAPMNTPVFIKDEDGDIGIGVCCEIIRNNRDFKLVKNKAWKNYFNVLGDPMFWMPINWPGV